MTTPWWVHRHRLTQPNPPSQTGVDPGGPHFIWKRESIYGRGQGTHTWLQSRRGDREVQGLRPSWTTSSGLETPRQRANAAPSERSLTGTFCQQEPPRGRGQRKQGRQRQPPQGEKPTDVQAWPWILLPGAEGPSLCLRTTSRGHTHATRWIPCVEGGADSPLPWRPRRRQCGSSSFLPQGPDQPSVAQQHRQEAKRLHAEAQRRGQSLDLGEALLSRTLQQDSLGLSTACTTVQGSPVETPSPNPTGETPEQPRSSTFCS